MDETTRTIQENLANVHRRIQNACDRVSRLPSEVQLLAVSKLQPIDRLRAAFEAGHRDFGENYAQELRDKALSLADLEGIRWHAIGRLQTNKAKYVARAATAFHALDRLDVAQALGKLRQDNPLSCYVEVNLAKEQTKAGVEVSSIEPLVEQLRTVPGILVVGLMCMPPFSEDAQASRPYFQELREIAGRLGLNGLSMGTTTDFEVAIEEGATVVRVGTAIFGSRDSPPP